MSLKDKILELLNNSCGKYVSGEYLSEHFSVSRNAVWKAINSLRSSGYNISAVTNKGYMLDKAGAFSKSSVLKYLKSPLRIEFKNQVSSTNEEAVLMGRNGEPEGYVCIADYQSEGRGRKGRKFFSPASTGSYFSILLRPNINMSESLLITTASAAAISLAVEEVLGVSAGIKWVNDIYAEDKKVAGILTEAFFNVESGSLDYAVTGIGINIYNPEEYPEFIKNKAGALIKEGDISHNIRSMLTASIIDKFWYFYKNIHKKEFIDIYKSRSLVTGRHIIVENNGLKRQAFADFIDDNCRLNVTYDNGEKGILSSGEVSLMVV